MADGKYKDLNKRTGLDKILNKKAFRVASNQKYNRYQRGLASLVYRFTSFLLKYLNVVV